MLRQGEEMGFSVKGESEMGFSAETQGEEMGFSAEAQCEEMGFSVKG